MTGSKRGLSRCVQGAAVLAVASLMSACSLFSSSTAQKPAPLETLPAGGSAKVLWQARIDSVQFPLSIAARGNQFIVAGTDGAVSSLSADTGAVQWRAEVGQKLTAGVGSDGRFAAVVTRANELVVLDGGKVQWRKTLQVPVSTAPLVAGERVFVLTLDRAVLAYDVLDGRKLWEMRRPGDALTLAQASVLGAYKDTLIVGQGPRLAGVDPLRGTVRWEASVATPRGTNEVERLADLVGPLVRADNLLCARAFQSAVGCVNAERGVQQWMRNTGGVRGVGGDKEQIIGADGSDRMTAWKTSNGDVLWTADQFQHRKLSPPVVVGKQVLVGDLDGQVHLLSRETGKTQQRIATDGSAIVAAPVVLGNTALVATKNGGLFALRVD
ncbi:outer membrane protein assembly factor BamB [Paucibacter sp. APW11]|uniref:Outer membrane protein assembly factor BamB n=1 Tax=Roseateles aquae TaxID=3077235 RepID=A0ABU3P9X7_9BURK|nr:outer membrane protein assembly factor BamB [Paucibacter sp. APW11]MDT8998516.1 outer membrane protein assembly factor BamB [Paucibacter sp. APW11]